MSGLEEDGILTIPDWPTISLYINIIENVWKVVEDCLQKASIYTLDELGKTSEKEFPSLSNDYIKNFSSQYPGA